MTTYGFILNIELYLYKDLIFLRYDKTYFKKNPSICAGKN